MRQTNFTWNNLGICLHILITNYNTFFHFFKFFWIDLPKEFHALDLNILPARNM